MTVVQTREYVVPAPRDGGQAPSEPRPETRARRTRPRSEYWDFRTAQWVSRAAD